MAERKEAAVSISSIGRVVLGISSFFWGAVISTHWRGFGCAPDPVSALQLVSSLP